MLRLLNVLGHDPSEVSSVNIQPGYVTVEYLHPITDDTVNPSVHRIEED